MLDIWYYGRSIFLYLTKKSTPLLTGSYNGNRSDYMSTEILFPICEQTFLIYWLPFNSLGMSFYMPSIHGTWEYTHYYRLVPVGRSICGVVGLDPAVIHAPHPTVGISHACWQQQQHFERESSALYSIWWIVESIWAYSFRKWQQNERCDMQVPLFSDCQLQVTGKQFRKTLQYSS